MNRYRIITGCVLMFAASSPMAGYGVEVALVPVDATGPHTIVGREIIVHEYGLQVTLELRLSDWGPQWLHLYQAQIDSSGYTSGSSGFLEPLTLPDRYAGGFIDVLHPEYVFGGLMVIAGIDASGPDYRYGGFTWDEWDSVLDLAGDRYGGTLILNLSADAGGTFVVGFRSEGSFVINDAGVRITPLVLTPAMITVDIPVVTGRCCSDFPYPMCTVTTNSQCAQQGGLFTADAECLGAEPCPMCVANEHCDDQNACTNDRCQEGACEYSNRIGGCNDGDPCTSGDVCTDGVCRGQPRGNCCRTNVDCDDGAFCNGIEQCGGGSCNVGQPPCLLGRCDEIGDMCLGCDSDSDCDDGLFCNGSERCAVGYCTPGMSPCLGQVCNEQTGVCARCVTDSHCDDGSFCNGVEQCIAGQCASGLSPCPWYLCDEGEDFCAECVVDGDCDDGLFCNGSERCTDGVCVSDEADPCPEQYCSESRDECVECREDAHCDDFVPCTRDHCEFGACFYSPDNELCPDDGLFCTGGSICDAELGCAAGPSPCLAEESCNEEEDRCDQCVTNGDCDDGRFCNGEETCLAGVCVSGLLPCPHDICDEFGDSCVECLLASACDDGDPCTIDDCVGGLCEHTPNPDCDTLGEPADEDQDGVEDNFDICAHTAPLASVDADGCSCDQRDNDGDGVSDCEDQCLATPPNQRVGEDGCPLPVEDDIPGIDEPAAAPVAVENEENTAEIDPPVEATAAEEDDLSAVSASGARMCGSMAFIPIVFLMGLLVALRHRSLQES